MIKTTNDSIRWNLRGVRDGTAPRELTSPSVECPDPVPYRNKLRRPLMRNMLCSYPHSLSGAVFEKTVLLASPLTKGGLRGVLHAGKNLFLPLLVKEGSRKRAHLFGNSTGLPHQPPWSCRNGRISRALLGTALSLHTFRATNPRPRLCWGRSWFACSVLCAQSEPFLDSLYQPQPCLAEEVRRNRRPQLGDRRFCTSRITNYLRGVQELGDGVHHL